jgi:nucleoside-diphosphate-sugar epimerase
VRILVTGAFGYLGLTLIGRLAGGNQVVAFGHPPRAAAPLPPNVTAVHGDILDVAPHARDVEAIVHLAGGGGPARVEADPTAAVRANVLGTARLVAAARGARILFASTIQVYGTHRAPPGGRPYRESDPTAADDLYGAIKEAAEAIVTGAGGTAVRLSNLYGAGAGVDLGIQGAVERFARAAAAGEELTLYAPGTQRIDYLHVDDACAAFALALGARELPPVLNAGGGAPVSVGELASLCVGAAHKQGARPRIAVRQPPDGARVWPDRSLHIGLIGNLLGWRPQVKLQSGIEGLVAMMARGATPT